MLAFERNVATTSIFFGRYRASRLLQNRVGVERVRDRISFLPVMLAASKFLLSHQLRGGFPSGCFRLAEEPHESLDVLSRCRQEELLSGKLEPAEAQAAQPDLVLEFREQRFRLPSLSLGGSVQSPDSSHPTKVGEYLTHIGMCSNWHNGEDQQETSLPYASEWTFEGPDVKTRVAASNLTPDASGIVYYDEAMFIRTMRTGHVGARDLDPAMPWRYSETLMMTI